MIKTMKLILVSATVLIVANAASDNELWVQFKVRTMKKF